MDHLTLTDIGWRFDNSYARLPEILYVKRQPVPVRDPAMVILNQGLAGDMGLAFEGLSDAETAAIFAGNALPHGGEPLAQAYAGHQFGHFTMLGDGRAILLGELTTPDGRRLDIQLKGSGRTPFSRSGDGRAALGPMLREYLVSEAMHALGIPTTRSLAVVTTGEDVIRETILQGAILTRIASSHLRVGTFQYLAMRGDFDTLNQLVAYAIDRHDPQLAGADEPAIALFEAVMERQARLIAEWMRVGFIHGVMNTDNMAISGETIDYGPCAFIDAYDPRTVFSSIDLQGRYAFGNQPGIAQWNLARFAEALLPLIDADRERAIERATELITGFADRYETHRLAMLRRKLGLGTDDDDDATLAADLLSWMEQNQADYTNTFRTLTASLAQEPHRPEQDAALGDLLADEAFATWHRRWQARLAREEADAAHAIMQQANPAIIPRNHKVEEALAAATNGDLKPLNNLLEALADPYDDRPALDPYRDPAEPGSTPYQTFCGT